MIIVHNLEYFNPSGMQCLAAHFNGLVLLNAAHEV